MTDSVEGSREAIRMWRVFRTTKQMLQDRGYVITDEETSFPLDEFIDRYCDRESGQPMRKQMSFSARPSDLMMGKYTGIPTKRDPNPEPQIGTVWVEFHDPPGNDKTLGTQPFKNFIQFIVEKNYYTGIFICGAALTNNANKLIPTALPRIIEYFNEQDLLVNITKHELVPKHVVLSTLEKKQLLERYRLKETQLPRIQSIDPVAKYLGLRRGQVVKIIRRSETAGRYASYRWCL